MIHECEREDEYVNVVRGGMGGMGMGMGLEEKRNELGMVCNISFLFLAVFVFRGRFADALTFSLFW